MCLALLYLFLLFLMGNRTSQYLQEGLELLPLFASHKTDRLLATLINLRRLFFSQIAVLAIEGFLIGYYAVTVTLMFRKNLEEERQVKAECPICQKAPFQIICKRCGKILSCGECFAKVEECPKCCEEVGDEVIKVYMA